MTKSWWMLQTLASFMGSSYQLCSCHIANTSTRDNLFHSMHAAASKYWGEWCLQWALIFDLLCCNDPTQISVRTLHLCLKTEHAFMHFILLFWSTPYCNLSVLYISNHDLQIAECDCHQTQHHKMYTKIHSGKRGFVLNANSYSCSFIIIMCQSWQVLITYHTTISSLYTPHIHDCSQRSG